MSETQIVIIFLSSIQLIFSLWYLKESWKDAQSRKRIAKIQNDRFIAHFREHYEEYKALFGEKK